MSISPSPVHLSFNNWPLEEKPVLPQVTVSITGTPQVLLRVDLRMNSNKNINIEKKCCIKIFWHIHSPDCIHTKSFHILRYAEPQLQCFCPFINSISIYGIWMLPAAVERALQSTSGIRTAHRTTCLALLPIDTAAITLKWSDSRSDERICTHLTDTHAKKALRDTHHMFVFTFNMSLSAAHTQFDVDFGGRGADLALCCCVSYGGSFRGSLTGCCSACVCFQAIRCCGDHQNMSCRFI